MGIYGLTKGTDLEEMIRCGMEAEANGTAMYYSLARIAREQGLDEEICKTFIEAANQESVHAGFYATLNGKFPADLWTLVAAIRNAEYAGEKSVAKMAEQVRAAGFNEAADEMEIFAKQEKHHGEMLDELLKKFKPEGIEIPEGKKVYVCPVCGYEYVGDLDSEPDDWKCPLCGQPKSVFKEKV